MTDGNKMSRRDWFRLRLEPADSGNPVNDTDHSSIGHSPHGLQPIAQPVNLDGMDMSELPPLREALLSEAQVRQLFADIESLGSNIVLMQRSIHSQRATASKATAAEQLRTAQEALLSSGVPRMQIRYHWQDTDWIDTLERRDNGIRLVRIAHDPAAFAKRASPGDPR